ncbi:MAG: TIR domain-containing protein [Lachnospiraceae bacterium]|nr:TIR domain-containing protein [Lachnospiraceae bacterium]
MVKCDETKPYIFISYSHRDSDKVIKIVERLQSEGYNVWYDEGIDPGTEWDENIAKHVSACSYFIAFISNGYIGSKNCKDELNYSRELDKEQLLVYLEEVNLSGGMAMRMNRIQAIFWYKYDNDNTEDAYQKLFSARGIDKTKQKSTETAKVYEAAEAPVVAEMSVYETPVQPVSNMVQPQNSAVKPVKEKKAKEPKAPKEKKAKKKVWPLLLVPVVVAAIAVIVAFALGLFEKKTIRVEDTSVTVVVGEEYSVSVLNYKDIGKPELTWTVEDDSIAEVEFNRGSATIIGLEEGTTDIVVSGPWCKDRTIHVTVVLFELEGASFESTFYEYYFLEDGTYYIFSKTLMDHYTGEYSMEEYEKEDVVDLGLEFLNEEDVSEMLDRVEDGVFFIIELDGVNYYNGYAFEAYGYQTMCICTNGEDTYTCSSFGYYKAETSEIPMEDEDDLEERMYGTN